MFIGSENQLTSVKTRTGSNQLPILEYVTGPRLRTLSLTKRSDKRLHFKLKNIIQRYNADRKMHQSALGQILISFKHR